MSGIIVGALVTIVAGLALGWSDGAQRVRRVLEDGGPRYRSGDVPRQQGGSPDRTDRPDRAPSLVNRRSPTADDVPLLLELLGVMLQAGLGLPRALEVAARVADGPADALTRAAAALQLGTDWAHAWPDAPPSSDVWQLREALDFAAATGAPSAELLYARARQLRRSRHRDLERRAAALGVRLVIPLGVCSLPAFLCLGVVPVLLAMIPGG
ncbi:type II secretion system F family protein [Sinomonas sp. ASV486]|uniref:Type II secretion system F family protein n=1 Tax=Sinomonas puerhi TaxID=3238584 RepID=A0AB39L2X2_9MICC|nr:type II secretion system F family protein [Sinomonas sp. ASV486]MDQ4492102.1 type II secretion system F family protein [Sinomonas sp. ASV486]